MSQNPNGRLTVGALARTAPCHYVAPWRLVALVVLIAGLAGPAQAQFGGLKKLKKAINQPDTATQVASDSTAQPPAQATDVGKPKRSFLSQALSTASSASNKMEKATGISAKDAALAASGVGVAGMVAKKMGGAQGLTNPGGMGGGALKNAAGSALKQKLLGKAGGVMGGVPGGVSGGVAGAISGAISGGAMSKLGVPASPGTSSAAALSGALGNAMGSAAMGKAAMGKALSSAGMGTQADAAAMLAFQQDMMQTAAAASAGDRNAQARLDAWQAISLKYEAEALKLSTAAGAGDVSAVLRLQQLQVNMMREWTGTRGVRP